MMNFTNAVAAPITAHVQQGYGWHMHDGGYMTGSYWGAGLIFHSIFWLILLGTIIAAVFLFARGGFRNKSGKDVDGGSPALDELDQRYARGEIEREEYLQRKKDILER